MPASGASTPAKQQQAPKLNVLVIEDSDQDFILLEHELSEQIDGISIERVSSEEEFHERRSEICGSPPHLIVLDVVLRRQPLEVSDSMEVSAPGYAGLRIWQSVRADFATQDIPVLVCSYLDTRDFAAKVA